MPHLKFTRDHRGYENTFLVDTIRRRGREQSRVLYWFRTPPQVKVGRSAIDEDAIRALEDAYPGVAFDWNRILEARPPEPEPIADDPRRRPRGKSGRDRERERDGRRDARPERPSRPDPPAAAARPDPVPPQVADEPVDAPQAAAEAESLVSELAHEEAALVAPADASTEQAAQAAPDLIGEEDEADAAGEAPALPAYASEPSAAERILGSEGLQRLRARHAEVCARIAAHVADPERQESLRTLAERLNPDAWVTEPDVRAGLEQFEQVLDQVRREVGPLRKRTRRGGRRNRRRREGQVTTPAGAPEAQVPSTDEASDDGPDDEGGAEDA